MCSHYRAPPDRILAFAQHRLGGDGRAQSGYNSRGKGYDSGGAGRSAERLPRQGRAQGAGRLLWVSPRCHGNPLLLDRSTELKYLT